MTDRPLAGLRIVELNSFVAGPSATMALAQLGADVIRIDPAGGGPDIDRWPLGPNGTSLYWNSLNKGKRSITLDLRSDAGQTTAQDLITAPGQKAGIFIDNSVGRGWLDYGTLAARRPDLIHLRIQGHPDGRPAVDYTVNAEIGLPALTGPRDHTGPVNHVLPAWDLLAGMTAATGLLAAVHRRTATGRGAYIRLALSDVAEAAVANLGWLAEEDLRPGTRTRDGNYLYGSFGTAFATHDDRQVMVIALTRGQWNALQRATGLEKTFAALETALDADFSDDSQRYEHRETLTAILRPWFAARDLAEVRETLTAQRVLFSAYSSMSELVTKYRAEPGHTVLADVDQPGVGTMLSARSPLRWNNDYYPAAPAPALGQHTADLIQSSNTTTPRAADGGPSAASSAPGTTHG